MIEETPINTGTAPSPETPGAPIVSFCQQCGRGLTAATQHRVGAGVFCGPCGAVRSGQEAGWTSVNGATGRPFSAVAPAPGNVAGSEPNPMLAGLLGLIPGVGAMFNGQYAKAVIHLVIFVVLVSLADNLNWVLWWFVWGWVFYQGFEAYHTAMARRDGQPLPDPFGWNELGERFGFARSWPPTVTRQVPLAPQPTPATDFAASMQGDPFRRTESGGDPYSVSGVGSVPAPPVPEPDSTFSAAAATPHQTPYVNTYTGTAVEDLATRKPVADDSAGQGSAAQESAAQGAGYQAAAFPSVRSRHFPIGAAWLIGLGILFLLGNLLPAWHLDGRWLVPILLAAVALWTGTTRLLAFLDARSGLSSGTVRGSLPGTLLGPLLLLTVAILLALQDASVLPLRHSWPVILIVWGGVLFLERTTDRGLPRP